MEDEKQSLATAKGWEGFRSTFNEVVLASFCDGSATENTSDPDPPGAYAVVTRCFCPGKPNDGKRIEFAYHVGSSYSTSKAMEAAGALQAVRFSFAHIRHTLQGVPQPQRPAMATIMVFFDCQSVQKDLLSGRYAEERLSWHVVYNQLLGQIAQLSQEIADNDLGVVIGLELRWIKGHAKGHATNVDAHNCVHKLAYAARDGASIGMIGGARVSLFPGVLDGNYKTFLDGLYTSSNLPYNNKKRKAALFESTPACRQPKEDATPDLSNVLSSLPCRRCVSTSRFACPNPRSSVRPLQMGRLPRLPALTPVAWVWQGVLTGRLLPPALRLRLPIPSCLLRTVPLKSKLYLLQTCN